MSAPAPHIYVDSDIPSGLTILEWRRERHAAGLLPSRRHPVRNLIRRLHAA